MGDPIYRAPAPLIDEQYEEIAGEPMPDPAELISRLFPRRRARLTVEVDLDPVPGWGNNPEDWQRLLQRHLEDVAAHYHPTVTIEETPDV